MIKGVFRKEQMHALESFFRGYAEKNGYQKMIWFVTGFCIFLLSIIMALPYQLWAEEGTSWMGIGCGVSVIVATTYLGAYLTRQGQNAGIRSFEEILRFLPVSKWDLYFFRAKKLVCFQAKVYATMQILQLFFSIACLHQVVLGNVLYPFLIVFLVPVLMGMLFVLIRR